MSEFTEDNAGRNRQRLVDHIADQDRVIRRRNDEIAALREEIERLRHPWVATITLDSLAAAWEAAEQVDECCEGDVLIIRDDEDNYLVRRMCDRSDLDSTARILSRAPRCEPWADLADDLRVAKVDDLDMFAQYLHEAGWRKGGEDDE